MGWEGVVELGGKQVGGGGGGGDENGWFYSEHVGAWREPSSFRQKERQLSYSVQKQQENEAKKNPLRKPEKYDSESTLCEEMQQCMPHHTTGGWLWMDK
jgi:hypothetical protein